MECGCLHDEKIIQLFKNMLFYPFLNHRHLHIIFSLKLFGSRSRPSFFFFVSGVFVFAVLFFRPLSSAQQAEAERLQADMDRQRAEDEEKQRIAGIKKM